MKLWVPNALAITRVLLAFVLLVTYRMDTAGIILAMIIFVIAAVTDAFDGIIARRLKIAGYTGYLVDGFADRVFSAACILIGCVHHGLPLWAALLAITRELMLYTCRLIDPSAWHPPTRTARMHSVFVFGVTHLWFVALLVLNVPSLALNSFVTPAQHIANGIYSATLAVSVLILTDKLLRAASRWWTSMVRDRCAPRLEDRVPRDIHVLATHWSSTAILVVKRPGSLDLPKGISRAA